MKKSNKSSKFELLAANFADGIAYVSYNGSITQQRHPFWGQPDKASPADEREVSLAISKFEFQSVGKSFDDVQALGAFMQENRPTDVARPKKASQGDISKMVRSLPLDRIEGYLSVVETRFFAEKRFEEAGKLLDDLAENANVKSSPKLLTRVKKLRQEALWGLKTENVDHAKPLSELAGGKDFHSLFLRVLEQVFNALNSHEKTVVTTRLDINSWDFEVQKGQARYFVKVLMDMEESALPQETSPSKLGIFKIKPAKVSEHHSIFGSLKSHSTKSDSVALVAIADINGDCQFRRATDNSPFSAFGPRKSEKRKKAPKLENLYALVNC
jgi:hypothetical protein